MKSYRLDISSEDNADDLAALITAAKKLGIDAARHHPSMKRTMPGSAVPLTNESLTMLAKAQLLTRVTTASAP
ncbi:hypothetical protein [Mesorhizobium sp. WSM2239]|uniref:Uncharacterized protein n=2 Tax=unclassified Mesorhizobium TaxID=325217 RepID=A0AAU8DG48_9HYPH